MQYLIDNDIMDKGEYQLTNALENMKLKGTKFVTGKVDEWLDCGNKDATVYTNQRILEFKKDEGLVSDSVSVENSTIIEPCYIGANVQLKNAVIGPHVSIGDNSKIENTVVSNSIIQNDTSLKNEVLTNSMIGNFVNYNGTEEQLSIGDYSTQE